MFNFDHSKAAMSDYRTLIAAYNSQEPWVDRHGIAVHLSYAVRHALQGSERQQLFIELPANVRHHVESDLKSFRLNDVFNISAIYISSGVMLLAFMPALFVMLGISEFISLALGGLCTAGFWGWDIRERIAAWKSNAVTRQALKID